MIGHRGASGYLPEHTLAAYRLAVEQGADTIEPDVVITADGILIARHESELGRTTDIASRPEFADRRTAKVVDGLRHEGWFAEDLTLAEIRTLRAKERLPRLRPANTAYDGAFQIPTLDEILALRAQLEREQRRPVGVCLELKHPARFRRLGLPLEPPLVATLRAHGLDGDPQRVAVQSFEARVLQDLRPQLGVALVQLLGPHSQTPSGGLRAIARYASAVAPPKRYVVPRNADQTSGRPTTFVRDAHGAGLRVHVYTFRRENAFLPRELRSSSDPAGVGDMEAEVVRFLRLGVDAVITDNPDVAARAQQQARAA